MSASITEVLGGSKDPARQLAVPESLQASTRRDPWDATLEAVETVQSVEERLTNTRNTLKALNEATPAVTEWLERHGQALRLEREELLGNPYFEFEAIGNLLEGVLLRFDVMAPPHATVERSKESLALETKDDGFFVDAGRVTVRFPTWRLPQESQRAQMNLMAQSFAAGNVDNIRYYFERFKRLAREDLERSTAIEAELVELLASVPDEQRVAIDLLNDSSNSVSIYPVFQLTCATATSKAHTWTLRATGAASEVPSGSNEVTSRTASKANISLVTITVPRHSVVSVLGRPWATEAAARPTPIQGVCSLQATTLQNAVIGSATVPVGERFLTEWVSKPGHSTVAAADGEETLAKE